MHALDDDDDDDGMDWIENFLNNRTHQTRVGKSLSSVAELMGSLNLQVMDLGSKTGKTGPSKLLPSCML